MPRSSFFHRRVAIAVILVTLVLAGAAAWWWTQRQEPTGGGGPRAAMAGGAQAQPVSVGVVDRRDMRVLVSAIGTLNARATAVVRAKVTGELQKLYFREGDEVRAGQLLAQIDPRSYAATLNQARGTLQRDQALLRNAQLDLQRYEALKAQDSIASQQVDTQAALVRQYQGTVAADQAQVDMAQLQLDYTRITAPISGRLGLRQADLGNVVGPSDANGIVTITQIKPIDAVFALPEAHVEAITRRLAQGRPLPVELWDREQKNLLATGRLNALDNAIDPATGTVKAKAAFDNADGRLYPNQFVNVRLQLDLLEQALTVPSSAVQNNYVYLVQGDAVTQRRLTVGVTDGDRVSVRGELQPGDQVVTDGLDRLREGAKVTVIAADRLQLVDEAVGQAASRPRGARNLPPELRAKLATMSPEERRAYLDKLRTERVGESGAHAAASQPASPAAPSAPTVPASR